MRDECAKAGDDAASRAGVSRLNKGITKELGKLKFRTPIRAECPRTFHRVFKDCWNISL